MKKALTIGSGIALSLAYPLLAFAQNQSVRDIDDAGQFIINIINDVLVPVLFAIAFIVFLWGAFKTFIMGAQSEETKEQGKNLMLWGLIGFFVMVSIWGLVNILTGSVNIDTKQGQLPGAGGVR